MTFVKHLDASLSDTSAKEAFTYFKSNYQSEALLKEQKNVQRLLNFLSSYNMVEEIEEVFKVLLVNDYFFNSREYLDPVRVLIEANKHKTQLRVMTELVRNQVSMD